VCPPHVVLHRNYQLRQQIGFVMFLPEVDQPSNIIQGIFTSHGIILPGAQRKHVHMYMIGITDQRLLLFWSNLYPRFDPIMFN